MLARLQIPLPATGAIAALALATTVAGCGGGSGTKRSSAPAGVVAGTPTTHRTCPETVLDVLVRVARRI